MSSYDPKPNRRSVRAVLLAGGVALVLSGAGVAAVYAATNTPTPSPSSSASPGGHRAPNGMGHAGRGAVLHSESTVTKQDGPVETRVIQSGAVDAVSGSEVTVKSSDGFTQKYTINADTKILKSDPTAKDAAGNPAKPSTIQAADLKAGDDVHITGIKGGAGVTAQRILDGQLPAVKGGGLKGRGPGTHHGRPSQQATPSPAATP